MERFDKATSAVLDAHHHPLRREVDLLRSIILEADASIEEGVKWNTASFRTTEWFATLNGPKQVKSPMIILHAGAKVRGIALKDRIPDPEGLITWLGNDRGQIVFTGIEDISAKRQLITAIIRAWIERIRSSEPLQPC